MQDMSKIPYIKWEPAYSVTVEHIDEQHRKLFDIVNDLIDEVQMGSNRLLPIIRDLVHYVSVHFHDENMVMMKSGYPGFDKHNQEHRRFTEKVEEFLKSYKQGDTDLGLKMIIYMKEWIFSHTTRLDMEYAAHLKDTPAAPG
jgi:hemerythrin-like metal-binding protein